MNRITLLLATLALLLGVVFELRETKSQLTGPIGPVSSGVANLPDSLVIQGSFGDFGHLVKQVVHGISVFQKDKEKEAEQAVLSNETSITEAGEILSKEPTAFDENEERMRMRAIDFLTLALDWPENPARKKIIDVIEKSLWAENVKISDLRAKKSIVGDKMELFQTLIRRAPEKAKAIIEQSQGTWLASILGYAQGRYQFFAKAAL